MSRPRKIVVIDDEQTIRRMLENAFTAPEFEAHAFADPRDALVKLHAIGPDLIVCDVRMPEMDGPAFMTMVKESYDLRDVPFIFLSGVQSNDDVVGFLDGGADDFVAKPFHVGRLKAKIRALLRMVERRRDALTGPVGRAGALPLLKFCEDSRLTGRLTIEAPGQKRWAEFLGGEVMRAGGTPDTGDDALDALLAIEGGGYRIEQATLDRSALRQAEDGARPREAAAATSETSSSALPGGRLSMVPVRGQNVQVQTECENKPHFVVTTVIARSGQVIRKIESAWQHPLKRREDQEIARSQVDRQHDRVVATLRELTEARVAAAAAAPGKADATVDASLLAWAVSFIAEQVRDHLGAVMTVALLRRSHKELVRDSEVLRTFRIVDDGRVVIDNAAPADIPEAAVRAVALWVVAFLGASGEIVEKAGTLRVRQVTRMMEAELEKAGFYSAYEQASSPASA